MLEYQLGDDDLQTDPEYGRVEKIPVFTDRPCNRADEEPCNPEPGFDI